MSNRGFPWCTGFTTYVRRLECHRRTALQRRPAQRRPTAIITLVKRSLYCYAEEFLYDRKHEPGQAATLHTVEREHHLVLLNLVFADVTLNNTAFFEQKPSHDTGQTARLGTWSDPDTSAHESDVADGGLGDKAVWRVQQNVDVSIRRCR